MDSHALRSLQKKRTTNFREDETKLLIQLWGSPQIQKKLYLTHRKEPVMRLLAANMQQRGFYRTPDEIKTRIRNLKCLYHRIKRTVQNGCGIGTVDPDWPHYKEMDRILNKQNQKKENLYKENILEGPRCEDIKQEIDDIDINDDMESYTTNSLGGSDYEEEPLVMPPLTPAPSKDPKKGPQPPKTLPKILPNLTIPVQNQSSSNHTNQKPSVSALPFPLLILNGMPQNGAATDKKDIPKLLQDFTSNPGIGAVLKELLEVQKENLSLERQKLELEKQRLEFERFVGSQLLAMGPVFSTLIQKIALTDCGDEAEIRNSRKRVQNFDLIRESKILRNLLHKEIKKFMMGESDVMEDDENEDESGEDSDNKPLKK